MNLLQTLAGLNNPESTIDDIHALVSRDVALGVKALNYVNSAASGLTRRIESIREALVYLGRDTIRRWVSLYVIASGEPVPEERITFALQRAKVCDLLSARSGRGSPDACFTAGLFSSLDALLNTPLPELLEQMHLSEEMRAALLCHAGDTGTILACAQQLEAGDTGGLSGLGLSDMEFGTMHIEALCWTDEALRDLGLD